MSEKKDSKLSVLKKGNKISVLLIAVILATVAASVIIGAVGNAVDGARKKREQEEYIAGNDIRDMFAKKLTFTDDDPDTDSIQYFLTDSPNYKETGRIEVKGFMLHSIGAAFTNGKAMADQFGASDFRYAGVHGFIDSETGDFYHTLPWDQQAWHAGDGASDYIGIEMCESDAGYYTDDYVFHPEDIEKAREHTRIVYEAAVKLFAKLCLKYEFDPMKDGVIVSHKEGANRGIATRHGDPDEYWENVKIGYTMDGFRKDVKDYINTKIVANLKYTPIKQILKKYIIHEKA